MLPAQLTCSHSPDKVLHTLKNSEGDVFFFISWQSPSDCLISFAIICYHIHSNMILKIVTYCSIFDVGLLDDVITDLNPGPLSLPCHVLGHTPAVVSQINIFGRPNQACPNKKVGKPK